MMVLPPLVRLASNAPEPLNIGGFQITVLASTRETGSYELFRIAGPEGTGPGPHYHPWDESFLVLSGTVYCGINEEKTLVTAGALIHVPGGTTHWFKFAEGGGEFFSITSHGQASEMFAAFDKGVNWQNPDRAALTALAASYGQVVVS
jgi:quercetin dioxygenase-like cupin family protein